MLKKIDNPAQLKLDLFTTVVGFERIAPITFQPIVAVDLLENLCSGNPVPAIDLSIQTAQRVLRESHYQTSGIYRLVG